MSYGREIRSGLIPALLALGSNLGGLLEHEQQSWSSPTFSGVRHTVTLEFVGDAAVEAGNRLIRSLGTYRFYLSGYSVTEQAIGRAHFGKDPQPRLEVEIHVSLLEDA